MMIARNSMQKYSTQVLVSITAIFALGIGFFLGHTVFKNSLTSSSESRESKGTYSFVSPLLECNFPSEESPAQVNATKNKVEEIVKTAKQKGILTESSVYYRDLNNGPRFTTYGELDFTPSSLLKVPLMIAIYKEAESNPGFLEQKIEFAGGSVGAVQDVSVGDPITPGNTYTIEELVRHMIINSDNNAALLLYQALGYEKISQTYSDLAIKVPAPNADYSMTVSAYATFFRLLYNGTYITPDYSERALKILSESDYRDGIVAGVKEGTVVSHKFGERHYSNEEGIEQLHDCGIVYKPNHPYLLCIMTRGKDVTSLSAVIKDISSTIYENSK